MGSLLDVIAVGRRLSAFAARCRAGLEQDQRLLLPREEWPRTRHLAGGVVAFCRAATEARIVIVAWGF